MKVPHALVIGRFQPFHQGHVFLIESALDLAQNVSICIGSANIINDDNPFPYEKRLRMVEEAIAHNNWSLSISHIIPSDDIPDDAEWLNDIVKKLPPIDLVVGNNDWVNGICKAADYPVKELEMHNRTIYEGKTIRRLMREHNHTWKTYVPDYIAEIIVNCHPELVSGSH